MRDISTAARIGQLEDNAENFFRGVVLPKVTASATPGDPFSINHPLGTIPRMVAWLPFTNCAVWAEEADERLWSEKRVVLRCSVALAPMRVTVFE